MYKYLYSLHRNEFIDSEMSQRIVLMQTSYSSHVDASKKMSPFLFLQTVNSVSAVSNLNHLKEFVLSFLSLLFIRALV